MEKSQYSKKLYEHKKSDPKTNSKSNVKTGCYKKDDKYYIVFYTGVKDVKVKDYVKLLGGKYRPDLSHVDEESNQLSDKKCHGWLVDPDVLKVEHLNNLIEYGTDNESLLKTLQSEHIDYDPDKPKTTSKKSPDRQSMTPPSPSTPSKTHENKSNHQICINIKNSSNQIVSNIKCSIVSKINDFNYITDMGEIFKTSSGWQFVSNLKMDIEFESENDVVNSTINNTTEDSSKLSIPKEAVFLGGLTNAYVEMKNLLISAESPDCDDDD